MLREDTSSKSTNEAQNTKGKFDRRRTFNQKSETRHKTPFDCRSEEECLILVNRWMRYIHPRARDFFGNDEQIKEVLAQLVKFIDKHQDPILAKDETCVYWYGDCARDTLQPAIRILKPNEDSDSVTYVNRILGFMFAPNEHFDELMKLPKEPFKMRCGNQLCVHLGHISLCE